MWVALNNAFLSIVAPAAKDIPADERKRHGRGWETMLMVRARNAAHLRAVFPGHKVHVWKGRDYPCRVFINRGELAGLIATAVREVSYSNFKNSVRDDELHDAYSAVWGVMHRYQHGSFRRAKPGKQASFGPGRGRGYGRGKPAGRGLLDNIEPEAWVPDMHVDDQDWDRANRPYYGPFDSGDEDDDDSGAQSHLRVPPR